MNSLFSSNNSISNANTLPLSFTVSGDGLQSTQQLGQFVFTAVSNQTSAFIGIHISQTSARQTDGKPIPYTLINSGRIVVVADESLLEALCAPSSQRRFILYGRSTANYTIEAAENLATPTWSEVLSVTETNHPEALTLHSNSAPTVFYRAKG